MKVVTIVGARPQFIKAAVVGRKLRKKHKEVLVHTGQHYDYRMSELFFKELDIPEPDYNMGISGGSHAEITGRMMIEAEKVLKKEMPDWLLVYGDTNSTMAAALAAAKLHIRICHVEAGARTHSFTNPEEINRICTDHISTLLLASTESSMVSMEKEGLSKRGTLVGDPMYDAFLEYSQKEKIGNMEIAMVDGTLCMVPKKYYYMTCHREENTNNDSNLLEILKAMEQLDAPTIYPVHPRNRERALRLKQKYQYQKVLLTEPVGYLESIYLVNHAEKIVTDSGGLQREAFFAEKKCVTILDFVCWPETMVDGRNELAKPDTTDILKKLENEQKIDKDYMPFGNGRAADKIIKAMENIK